jgi:hypothetical protein
MPKACIYAGFRHFFINWLWFGSVCESNNGKKIDEI